MKAYRVLISIIFIIKFCQIICIGQNLPVYTFNYANTGQLNENADTIYKLQCVIENADIETVKKIEILSTGGTKFFSINNSVVDSIYLSDTAYGSKIFLDLEKNKKRILPEIVILEYKNNKNDTLLFRDFSGKIYNPAELKYIRERQQKAKITKEE